jgi:hypothetical protein
MTMVKDYVIYRFEKVKVAEVTLDNSVKGWLDTVLRTRGWVPAHLADRATSGAYDEGTGNYLICDPSSSPEMPLAYVEAVRRHSDRPNWTRPSNSSPRWLEDDATVSLPDHERVLEAYSRIFNEPMGKPLDIWYASDVTFFLLPAGRVVIKSYPGNSEIRQLSQEAEIEAGGADPLDEVCRSPRQTDFIKRTLLEIRDEVCRSPRQTDFIKRDPGSLPKKAGTQCK